MTVYFNWFIVINHFLNIFLTNTYNCFFYTFFCAVTIILRWNLNFNSLSTSLNQIQAQANYEVKNQVSRINSLSGQIATLTQQINTVEIGGQNANDLRDQRELLIDELSEYVNVTVDERKIGTIGKTEYIVYMDGQTLVDNYDVTVAVSPTPCFTIYTHMMS